MKLRFNLFFLFLYLTGVSFLGEILTQLNDDLLLSAAEACERVEREGESETNLEFDTFKNHDNGGAGGKDVKVIVADLPKFENLERVLLFIFSQNTEGGKQYENRLLNSVYLPKLYRLFCCPKSYLS
jgi:hypothetical protein